MEDEGQERLWEAVDGLGGLWVEMVEKKWGCEEVGNEHGFEGRRSERFDGKGN